jgi:hypothetical protein
MASVFKALVTRLAKSAKELKAQENMVKMSYFSLSLMEIKCIKLTGYMNNWVLEYCCGLF